MVINIGDTNDPICIADNATKTGNYNLYLKPAQTYSEAITDILVNSFNGFNDTSLDTTAGGNMDVWRFPSCKIAFQRETILLIKAARQKWSADNLLLYLFVNDRDGANCAYYPQSPVSAVAFNISNFDQITMKIGQIVFNYDGPTDITMHINNAKRSSL